MGAIATIAKFDEDAATPVDRVVRVFGAKRAAQLVDLTTEAVRKWKRGTSKGGGGGLVPSRYQMIYLSTARREGLDLRAADFIADPRP